MGVNRPCGQSFQKVIDTYACADLFVCARHMAAYDVAFV